MKFRKVILFTLFLASYLFVACDKDVACDNGSEERKEYYDSGEIESITTLDQNGKEDKFISYYKSGKIKQKGQYKAGRKEGPWKTWHENGKLKLYNNEN